MSLTSRSIGIHKGAQLFYRGRLFEIGEMHSDTDCAGVLLDTGEKVRVKISELTAPTPQDAKEERSRFYAPAEWAKAKRRYDIIEPLLHADQTTTADVVAVANKHDVGTGTIFRWLRIYRAEQDISALVPMPRGRKEGDTSLAPELEEIIDLAFETKYLRKDPPPPMKAVFEEIHLLARARGMKPPSAATVYRRLNRIPHRTRLRRRGRQEMADALYNPVPGELDVRFPLESVQVDHTLCDVMVVTEAGRNYPSRPWITVAIDTFSRMIVGLYISMEAPSATSVAMCMANAICTKDAYLKRLNLHAEWPIWGFPDAIHTDNGKDFHAKSLIRACETYGIVKDFRPLGKKNYGGRIERFMGTLAGELKKLPGATMANVEERGEYDSAGKANLTLRELERYLVNWIVNVYNRTVHSSIHMAPLDKWRLGILGDGTNKGRGIIDLPRDPEKIVMNFLTFEMRTIQADGVSIYSRMYYDPILHHYINEMNRKNPELKRKFLFRVDGRDVSKIYFLEPNENRYYEIAMRTVCGPISEWEYNEERKRQKANRNDEENEAAIIQGIMEGRQILLESEAKTRKERKNRHRLEQLSIARDAAGNPQFTTSDDQKNPSTAKSSRLPQSPPVPLPSKFNFPSQVTTRKAQVLP